MDQQSNNSIPVNTAADNQGGTTSTNSQSGVNVAPAPAQSQPEEKPPFTPPADSGEKLIETKDRPSLAKFLVKSLLWLLLAGLVVAVLALAAIYIFKI